jgi:AraC-like DNA-binding protein
MSSSAGRRRIDWDVILPGHPPLATMAASTAGAARLAALTTEVTKIPSPETLARILLHAVEFARAVIGFERTAVYLLDEKNQVMVGTFGTDAQGQTIDEHSLTYQFGSVDREIFARADQGNPWTVYENVPHIAQSEGKTRILGHGWVAGTAIRGRQGPLGIFFNDTALTHSALDETKQLHAAILCSLLGRAIEPCRSFLIETSSTPHARRGVVQGVTELLVRDPSLSCGALASDLKLSPRRLTQAFKREANTSIVEYRNEVRLTRFFERVDASAHNLLEAALAAGFGSYAQFHRVFRARFGQSPREYLLGPRR